MNTKRSQLVTKGYLPKFIPKDAVDERIENLFTRLDNIRNFGLVFEEHPPEKTELHGLLPTQGDIVRLKGDSAGLLWRVIEISNRSKIAKIEAVSAKANQRSTRVDEIIVVRDFGQPIFPALSSVGRVERDKEKPFHAVINGENFHALQMMLFQFKGKVDCIYIDPPYNTGARDWKYNNRYFDNADTWKHSRWLSFMEKRLNISKKLLKTDGVLILTIDEHEVHHVGMLLEKIFPEYHRYMITMVINPKGTGKVNFARVDEYIFFVVPNTGKEVITGTSRRPQESNESSKSEWEFRHLRRRGNESSYRHQRLNQFFPIYVDEKSKKVVGCGESVPLTDLGANVKPSKAFRARPGLKTVWPIDKEGLHRCWRFIPMRMEKEIKAGRVVLGKYNSTADSWTLNLKLKRNQRSKLKTVWTAHDYPSGNPYDSGTHGTELLKKILGQPGLFPFPKSVYAVRDCLSAVVADRPNALILDFFAGSGTTLHSTCLLNQQLGGQRRCILVTNNEVSEKVLKKLESKKIFRGHPEFESNGIFELVTKPRCTSIITGKRPDGADIPGHHIDLEGAPNGSPLSEGFRENVEFFKVEYLNPHQLKPAAELEAILPLLWLAAGGKGCREVPKSRVPFSIPDGSNYAVLFEEAQYKQFQRLLEKRDGIDYVWVVADSAKTFSEIKASFVKSGCFAGKSVIWLGKDLLGNFTINTEKSVETE